MEPIDDVIGNSCKDYSSSEAVDDELLIVAVIEPKVTDEDVEKARGLKLPDSFYAYEQRPACSGCRGCENEGDDASPTTEKDQDEEQMFAQRAKLYQYDSESRKWIEQGVGEMKLLYHQASGRYRLLLREEQVQKVVLNQLLTTDLEMKPKKQTKNALLWSGFNHAEGEGKFEELAIKFKNQELVDNFREKIEEAKEQLASMETKPAPLASKLKGLTNPNSAPFANKEDTDKEETFSGYEQMEVMDEETI
ncbi:E3 SUMO-protein ligase RanBP2-like [Neocloeon triangulifer]|uniref:E3 SUMO-protein ligase RanBP2-like n=1 Tax=Neocloeon triangulifer TaxID=2078957 RepID=UPI00286ECB05|nr:E3 SUMO-protein ligase RanBP2-like [Neocloeon triangulifer]